LFTSPNIIRSIISRSMRWEGHEARMGEMRHAYKIFVGGSEGKRHLGFLGIDEKITLKWIFKILCVCALESR